MSFSDVIYNNILKRECVRVNLPLREPFHYCRVAYQYIGIKMCTRFIGRYIRG